MKQIIVPKTKEAMQRLDYGESSNDSLIETNITDDDYNILSNTGIFEKINNLLKIAIDEYEDESITDETKLNIAAAFLEEYSNKNIEIIDILTVQIKNAIQYKTGIFFYF